MLLDIIYPKDIYCVCCGNIIDQSRTYGLCDHCITHIKWNGSEPRKKNDLTLLSCADYGLYERSIIFALKYDGHKYLASNIAEIMRDRLSLSHEVGDISIDYDNTVIVPVPIHKRKLRERGYNHAELIAKELGKRMDLPVLDGLNRTRDTLPMKSLGPHQREMNIRESMEFRRDYRGLIEGMDVILVDDFFTTGSTARECARAISRENPRSILMLAFAAR